jgi:uncharacterized protein YjbJ (UPF0337 family)
MPCAVCGPPHRTCFSNAPFGHRSTKGQNKPKVDGGLTMSFTDKIKNKAEELAGKAKQGVGDATDNERLAAEGQAQETAAHAKQAGEHAKDAGRDVRDAFS